MTFTFASGSLVRESTTRPCSVAGPFCCGARGLSSDGHSISVVALAADVSGVNQPQTRSVANSFRIGAYSVRKNQLEEMWRLNKFESHHRQKPLIGSNRVAQLLSSYIIHAPSLHRYDETFPC